MKIYRVQEAGRLLSAAIQKEYIFKQITLRGTISGLHTHFSGVTFFSLIEGNQRISCLIGRMHRTFLTRRMESGLEASVTGDLRYDNRSGKPVLYVQRVMAVREGVFKQERDALEEELREKGFFNPAGKKPLPRFPFHVGVITSGSGAVIHDIMQTGRQKNDAVRYTLYHSAVQGEGAVEDLAATLRKAAEDSDAADVLILARGGGAEEDLAPFNARMVLEAIHDCPIPIISAVGHETDTTLADRVADRRASTPTQAAELAIPEKKWLYRELQIIIERMTASWQQHLSEKRKPVQQEMNRLCFLSQVRHSMRQEQEIFSLCGQMKGRVQQKISAGYKGIGKNMYTLLERGKDVYGR